MQTCIVSAVNFQYRTVYKHYIIVLAYKVDLRYAHDKLNKVIYND